MRWRRGGTCWPWPRKAKNSIARNWTMWRPSCAIRAAGRKRLGGRRGPAVEFMKEWDVIVVGGGNAAFCAAQAAREAGASVLMLEAAPEEESGGNSRFTAGAMRVVYNGLDDIKALVPDLSQAETDTTDFGTYTQNHFFDHMPPATQVRPDPNHCVTLAPKPCN